jgi:hypothetical protein
MFRRGGTVNDGIMTGLYVDRKQLANGTGLDVDRARLESMAISNIMDELAPIPKTKLPIGQFGLNLASGKFAGDGALQNIVRSAQDPYTQFTKADDARERAIQSGAVKLGIGQAMKESAPSNKFSQISLKAKEAFGNPNIKNPTTGKPFTSYGEAFTFFSMSAADPAARSIEGRIANDAKSYIGTYGNNTLAKRHAIADNIIAPSISRAEEKNYTGKSIRKKAGKYKEGQSPGVYVDLENDKVMVEVMPDGSFNTLKEYSKYFTQFQ